MTLVYLANVFGHFNDMNLFLQGRVMSVGDIKDQASCANCSNGSVASTN